MGPGHLDREIGRSSSTYFFLFSGLSRISLFGSCFSRLVTRNSGGVLFFSRDTCGPFPASSFWKCWACLQWKRSGNKTLGHSWQEAGPLHSFASFAPLCPLLPCAYDLIILWLPIYFLQCLCSLGLLLCQVQQTVLTGARSQVSAPFYTDQGYRILNPSIIWNLLGQWRGKSFPSLGAENGFFHIPQVCERERRNKQALAWDSPRLENSGKTCKFLVLE